MPMAECAESEADNRRDRHGKQDQRKRVHALWPIPGYQKISEARQGEERQPKTIHMHRNGHHHQHYGWPWEPSEYLLRHSHRYLE